MGAYGSPELIPPEKQYSYGTYQYPAYQQYDPKRKEKRQLGMFFLGFFAGMAVLILISFFAAGNSGNKGSVSANTPYARPSAVVQDGTQDYIKSWVKSIVSKGLLHPESAEYSTNASDWQIVNSGNSCDITSTVIAKGKTNQIGKSSFRVKISYGDLYSQITFVQLGNDVIYDSSVSEKAKK